MKNDNPILVEVLKGRYEYEQFRKNNFDNVIDIPVTILAFLMGGLATFSSQEKQFDVIIRIGALVGMIPIAISIFHLIRVFFGFSRKYEVLPTADIISDQYDPLDLRQKKLLLSFQDDLVKWYVASSRRNCQINDIRAEHFYKAKLWLIISIIGIFIILILQLIVES